MDIQHGGDKQADQREQRADAGGMEVIRKAGDGNERGGIHGQPRVL